MENKLKNNGYTFIGQSDVEYLKIKNLLTPKCKGKVVENCGYIEDEEIFIITFTDKTYIMLSPSTNDYDDPVLTFKALPDISQYSQYFYDNNFKFDSCGNMVIEPWVNMMIDFGLWNADPDAIKKSQEASRLAHRKRDYQRYLELKQKFENGEIGPDE